MSKGQDDNARLEQESLEELQRAEALKEEARRKQSEQDNAQGSGVGVVPTAAVIETRAPEKKKMSYTTMGLIVSLVLAAAVIVLTGGLGIPGLAFLGVFSVVSASVVTGAIAAILPSAGVLGFTPGATAVSAALVGSAVAMPLAVGATMDVVEKLQLEQAKQNAGTMQPTGAPGQKPETGGKGKVQEQVVSGGNVQIQPQESFADRNKNTPKSGLGL